MCVIGNAETILINGKMIELRNLRKGDVLENGSTVMLVIKYMVDRVYLCDIGGIWITPWHPIDYYGIWELPNTISKPVLVSTGGCIVDLILRPGSFQHFNVFSKFDKIIKCVGMAHEQITPRNGYWGTRKVLEDFRQHPEYESGVLHLRNTVIHMIDDSVIAQSW